MRSSTGEEEGRAGCKLSGVLYPSYDDLVKINVKDKTTAGVIE